MESSETKQEQERKVANNDVIRHFEQRLLQKPSTTAKLALPMLRLGNRTKFTIAMYHSRFHRKRIFRGAHNNKIYIQEKNRDYKATYSISFTQ